MTRIVINSDKPNFDFNSLFAKSLPKGVFEKRIKPFGASMFSPLRIRHETVVESSVSTSSFKKGIISNHPVGVCMVELPRGIIIEERRRRRGFSNPPQ